MIGKPSPSFEGVQQVPGVGGGGAPAHIINNWGAWVRALFGLVIAIEIFIIFDSGLLALLAFFFLFYIPQATKFNNLFFRLGMIAVIILAFWSNATWGLDLEFGSIAPWEWNISAIIFVTFWLLGLFAGWGDLGSRQGVGAIVIVIAFFIFSVGIGTQEVGQAFFGEWWPSVYTFSADVFGPLGEAVSQLSQTVGIGWRMFIDPVGYAQSILSGNYQTDPLTGLAGAYGVEIEEYDSTPIFVKQPFTVTMNIKNKGTFEAENVEVAIYASEKDPESPRVEKWERVNVGGKYVWIPFGVGDLLPITEMGFSSDSEVFCSTEICRISIEGDNLPKLDIRQLFFSSSGIACETVKKYELRSKFVPIIGEVSYDYQVESTMEMEFMSSREWNRRVAEDNLETQKKKPARLSNSPVRLNIDTLEQPVREGTPFFIGLYLESAQGDKSEVILPEVTLQYPPEFKLRSCTVMPDWTGTEGALSQEDENPVVGVEGYCDWKKDTTGQECVHGEGECNPVGSVVTNPLSNCADMSTPAFGGAGQNAQPLQCRQVADVPVDVCCFEGEADQECKQAYDYWISQEKQPQFATNPNGTIGWKNNFPQTKVVYCMFDGIKGMESPTRTFLLKANSSFRFVKWETLNTKLEFGGYPDEICPKEFAEYPDCRDCTTAASVACICPDTCVEDGALIEPGETCGGTYVRPPPPPVEYPPCTDCTSPATETCVCADTCKDAGLVVEPGQTCGGEKVVPPPPTADEEFNMFGDYATYISAASANYNVDDDLIKAMILQESNWQSDAGSSAGAAGLMQLTSGTASDLDDTNTLAGQKCRLTITDRQDPEQNINGGTCYFSYLVERFNDIELALAAYNWGPASLNQTMQQCGATTWDDVRLCSGVPTETKNYVPAVVKYYNFYNSMRPVAQIWTPTEFNENLIKPFVGSTSYQIVITDGYDEPRSAPQNTHKGYDFGTSPPGQLKSAWMPALYSGRVVQVVSNWGNDGEAVWVESNLFGRRFVTSYGHVNANLNVGDYVATGTRVGNIATNHLDVKMFDWPLNGNPWYENAFDWGRMTA